MVSPTFNEDSGICEAVLVVMALLLWLYSFYRLYLVWQKTLNFSEASIQGPQGWDLLVSWVIDRMRLKHLRVPLLRRKTGESCNRMDIEMGPTKKEVSNDVLTEVIVERENPELDFRQSPASWRSPRHLQSSSSDVHRPPSSPMIYVDNQKVFLGYRNFSGSSISTISRPHSLYFAGDDFVSHPPLEVFNQRPPTRALMEKRQPPEPSGQLDPRQVLTHKRKMMMRKQMSEDVTRDTRLNVKAGPFFGPVGRRNLRSFRGTSYESDVVPSSIVSRWKVDGPPQDPPGVFDESIGSIQEATELEENMKCQKNSGEGNKKGDEASNGHFSNWKKLSLPRQKLKCIVYLLLFEGIVCLDSGRKN